MLLIRQNSFKSLFSSSTITNTIHRIPTRSATYTVDVYLTRDHPRLGKAGSVVEVKPGYARNYLMPNGYGVLMGEGEFRKVLPILHHTVSSAQSKFTARTVANEIQKWLNYDPMNVHEYLEKYSAVSTVKQSESGVEQV